MGCCHLLYCHDRHDDKGNKPLTNFYASTEEGELILGDWAARAEEDRKAEFVKKRFPVSKTFRPMLSLERSPFFSDILLGVTDWAFFLWKDGVKEHLFQSSYTSTYFTRGVWSPTRPSVIFLGLNSGAIDIWDFSDQSHKAALSESGASVPITSMVFRKLGCAPKTAGTCERDQKERSPSTVWRHATRTSCTSRPRAEQAVEHDTMKPTRNNCSPEKGAFRVLERCRVLQSDGSNEVYRRLAAEHLGKDPANPSGVHIRSQPFSPCA